MSTEPYSRRQGDFELRVLKDGRLVMIAPDEALLEIAKAFKGPADAIHCIGEPEVHPESQHAEGGKPEDGPTSDDR